MKDKNGSEEKTKFNLFDYFRRKEVGTGPSSDEPLITDDPNFFNFFKLYGRKINNIALVNLLFVVTNFPIFFFLLGISGWFSGHTTAPAYNLFSNLSLIADTKLTPASAALYGTYSLQTNVTVLSVADRVFFWLTALLIFTLGISMTGITYIHRNIVRGEPVFILSDFIRAIKRNLKQSILFGVIDSVIIILLAYDFSFIRVNSFSAATAAILYAAIIVLIVLYFMMRRYIYTMIVTFDLPLRKLFKNALILSFAGFRRNAAYLLGAALMLGFNYAILIIYFPLGIILPFTLLPSSLVFLGEYCIFPNIMKYMVKDD